MCWEKISSALMSFFLSGPFSDPLLKPQTRSVWNLWATQNLTKPKSLYDRVKRRQNEGRALSLSPRRWILNRTLSLLVVIRSIYLLFKLLFSTLWYSRYCFTHHSSVYLLRPLYYRDIEILRSLTYLFSPLSLSLSRARALFFVFLDSVNIFFLKNLSNGMC